MIPSAFVFLDELPLMSTGKVNRRALPDPGRLRPDLDTPMISPRTTIEKEIAQIWAEVLLLDEVGVSDNFLDLGGHSLAASRIISQMIRSFQLELPIKALFDSPDGGGDGVGDRCQSGKAGESRRVGTDVKRSGSDFG
jgi:acyl carrier protein